MSEQKPINIIHMSSRDDPDSKEGMAAKVLTMAMVEEMQLHFPPGTQFILAIITKEDADITTSIFGKDRLTRMLQYILKVTRKARAQ